MYIEMFQTTTYPVVEIQVATPLNLNLKVAVATPNPSLTSPFRTPPRFANRRFVFCEGVVLRGKKQKLPPHFAALIGKFQRPGLWEILFACRGANQKRHGVFEINSEPWFRPVDR